MIQSQSSPTISVVVAAFNRESTLAKTLDSLLAQTYEDWEAIIVDDGSEDGTARLAHEYASRDARFRVHSQANGGVSNARNTGIALARAPWLFFLDADDWIVPHALERLTEASQADPEAEAVFGGRVQVDENGTELEKALPDDDPDLLSVFAKTCSIVIHSCLVRAELVRRLGSFDESLVTCEDWDLWQRIARVGTRFSTIPEAIAVYVIRRDSASRSGQQMLHDGLLVIDRGHGEDTRLQALEPHERRVLQGGDGDLAKSYFVGYVAGLEIAAGGEPLPMLDVLGDGLSAALEPGGMAETLVLASALGLTIPAVGGGPLPRFVEEACTEFIAAIGERLDDREFTLLGTRELERMMVARHTANRPFRAGRWYLSELDVAGPPPSTERLPDGIDRLLCKVTFATMEMGELEIPVVDGWMPDRVLADAIGVEFGWEIIQALMERDLYPGLQIERDGDRVRAERNGLVLFEGSLNPARSASDGLHDEIGWTLFLQELWGEPTLVESDFYVDTGAESSEPVDERHVRGGRIELDIAEALPDLRSEDPMVSVEVRVGGAPLTVVECKVDGGRVSAHDLRREILNQTGFELSRAVAREAVVLASAGATGSLRDRLAVGVGAAVIPEATSVVGRGQGGDGSSVSRWTVLPVAAAKERLELAARDGEPIAGDGRMAHLLSAPIDLGGARNRGCLPEISLLRSIEVERIQGARAAEGNGAARGRADEAIASILPVRVDSALELGVGDGSLTSDLAERAGRLTVADISPLALTRVKRRSAGLANVGFEHVDAFEGALGGPFDLIVCGGVLQYAESRKALDKCVAAMLDALVPGGRLAIAADGGDRAGLELAVGDTGMLDLEREAEAGTTKVWLYSRRRRPPRRPFKRRRTEPSEPPPEFTGAKLEGGIRSPSTLMPILMYHRVAPSGAPGTQRWRLHPDLFEEQLRYLRDGGYRTLTFDQWRVASDRHQPIPDRTVMLTFDDGYADFPTYALPLLEKYGFDATMFIVTDLVGKTNRWDERLGESLELMDWPTIEQIQSRGIEIGSHSAGHRPLIELSPSELTEDLCRSRSSFHENLSMEVRSVCYPYGLVDSGVAVIAGACGFHYGVTCDEWKASFNDNFLLLPRIEVRGTESLEKFIARLNE